MTDIERAQVMKMQREGLGYKRIATVLNLPINSVKTFCRRNPVAQEERTEPTCRNCGVRVEQTPHKRPKLYCSDQCRMAWWKNNRDKLNKRAYYHIVCQHCGKEFDSYGDAERKFCSPACYQASRTGGVSVG